jgi:serine/threonine protein kinase
MLQPGQRIDRYTVESVLGHGGTAVVYRVRHQQLGSQHALKVLSIASGAIRQRLLREGQVQAALQHTNIVTVTDVLEVGGNPGLLMEFIDGPALDQAMKRYRISRRDALTLFRGIVAGVRAAHRHGLVHRDLKPANVLLFQSPEGFIPKVTDFGLAKVVVGEGAQVGQTRQGIAMGTPAYMAPEQIRDAATVDQRADLFSLGCILYELLTGARAFPGDQALEIYNHIVVGRYAPPEELVPDLPDPLIRAIDGCLTVEKEARIPDCETLLAVLAGRRTWEAPAHPVPDEVLATEEIPRDAPDIPLAERKGTPIGAPPRAEDPVEQGDGTLGGEGSLVSSEGRSGRPWLALAGVAGLLLLLGLGLLAVTALPWIVSTGSGADGPSLAEGVDGSGVEIGRAHV